MENGIMIKFRSLDELWSFRIETLIDFIEMDRESCTLTCRCFQRQLQVAVKKYGARVVVGEVREEE